MRGLLRQCMSGCCRTCRRQEFSDNTRLWYRRALLHNLRFDESVAAFSNASGAGTADEAFLPGQLRNSAGGGACTAISFRTGVAASLLIDTLLGSGVEPLLLPVKRNCKECSKWRLSQISRCEPPHAQIDTLNIQFVHIGTLIFHIFPKSLLPLRVLPLVSCSVPMVSVHADIFFTSPPLPALCSGTGVLLTAACGGLGVVTVKNCKPGGIGSNVPEYLFTI